MGKADFAQVLTPYSVAPNSLIGFRPVIIHRGVSRARGRVFSYDS